MAAKKLARKTIEEGVATVVWDCLAAKWENVNDSLHEDLGADSLDIAEMAMGLEQQFEIGPVSDAEAEKLTTPLAMIELVERRLAG